MTNSEEPSAPDNLSTVLKKNSETIENGGRGCNTAGKAMHVNNASNGLCNGNASSVSGTSLLYEEDHNIPFNLIPGEEISWRSITTDGRLLLTNYRLYIEGKSTVYNIPLGLIEQVECRDIFFLHIQCKDARYIRCTFTSNDDATTVIKYIQSAISVPPDIKKSFAFTFFEKSNDTADDKIEALLGKDLPEFQTAKERFDAEIKRMEFNVQGPWRVSEENIHYELCGSYPQHIIVPCGIDKKKLEEVANFRSARRIPAVVWRHRRNGAVISRCSQPEVGWFGWRSGADEELVQYIVHACADNRSSSSTIEAQQSSSDVTLGTTIPGETPSSLSIELVPEATYTKKLLILDARSYTTAVANRARGGGCECLEYYSNCEIQFMNLANIHSIRKSFINMRQMCALPADQPNWYSQLESCKWLQHMSGLMKAALMIVTAVENDGRPVMVHCSDGWDRTPQMVSLAEILLDPYYRSIEGFQIMVEREWLDFGHKFGDRCGQPNASDDPNERCPVFLQWLDCLHQLLRQFPSAFEFNLSFLLKLAQHTYSNLFGTFLCNTARERTENDIYSKTHSVWKFLRSAGNIHKFRNNLYVNCDKVLWPSSEVRDLVLWSHVYLGYENPVLLPTEVVTISQDSSPAPSVAADGENSERSITCGQLKTKTRSYENLHTPHSEGGLQRRQSDPSLKDSFNASPNNSEYETRVHEYDMESDRMDGMPSNDGRRCLMLNPDDPDVTVLKSPNPSFLTGDDSESENEDTEPNSEGISNSTVINQFKIDLKSIESSTDTLVADTGVTPDLSCKPVCINKTEKLDLKATDDCQINYATESYAANRLAESENSLESYSLKNTMSELNIACMEVSNRMVGIGYCNNEETINMNTVEKCPAQTHEDFLVQGDHAGVMPALHNGLGIDNATPLCEVCETSKKLLGDLIGSVPLNIVSNTFTNNCSGMAAAASWHGGKYSSYNTPIHSTTPSTGIPTTPVGIEDGNMLPHSRNRQAMMDTAACSRSSSSSSSNTSYHPRSNFDVDGLTTLHDEIQSRVSAIIAAYRNQVESLHRELQLTRDALMKQVGHKCTHVALDRADDNVSLADSVCSGEHHSVGRESQHSHSSEFSWEAVEEKDTRPPLWLPDFAVTRCMGCDGKFWLGRRKHHCRSCGKIFCADCSEHTMTIPSENIYTPVRVCMSCYHRHNSSASTQNSMMASYAAAVAGDSSGHMNGTYANSSYSHETHHPESGPIPITGFVTPGYGSRFPMNDVPMLNGHSTCNGVSNAAPSKSKQNSVTADIHTNSNGVSNGHHE